jgi:hypothetical protein
MATCNTEPDHDMTATKQHTAPRMNEGRGRMVCPKGDATWSASGWSRNNRGGITIHSPLRDCPSPQNPTTAPHHASPHPKTPPLAPSLSPKTQHSHHCTPQYTKSSPIQPPAPSYSVKTQPNHSSHSLSHSTAWLFGFTPTKPVNLPIIESIIQAQAQAQAQARLRLTERERERERWTDPAPSPECLPAADEATRAKTHTAKNKSYQPVFRRPKAKQEWSGVEWSE